MYVSHNSHNLLSKIKKMCVPDRPERLEENVTVRNYRADVDDFCDGYDTKSVLVGPMICETNPLSLLLKNL